MRKLRITWLPILAGSITLALVATGVDAKKKPRPPDPEPDYVTTLTDNWAMWSGKHIYEITQSDAPNPNPRYCGDGGAGDPNPQGQVSYVCHQFEPWPMENQVHVELSSSWQREVEGRGADGYTAAELCDVAEAGLVMNHHNESLSRSYFYAMDPTWNDGPCIPDANYSTCLVKVYTQAYFTAGNDHCNNRGCGRLVELEGWGDVDPAGEASAGVWEYNPFVADRDIEIERLTVTFRAIRRDKVAARCHYNVRNAGIYFSTTIVEP